jgi:hypothetical protein
VDETEDDECGKVRDHEPYENSPAAPNEAGEEVTAADNGTAEETGEADGDEWGEAVDILQQQKDA